MIYEAPNQNAAYSALRKLRDTLRTIRGNGAQHDAMDFEVVGNQVFASGYRDGGPKPSKERGDAPRESTARAQREATLSAAHSSPGEWFKLHESCSRLALQRHTYYIKSKLRKSSLPVERFKFRIEPQEEGSPLRLLHVCCTAEDAR
jgi:uncharacterized protein (DUF608 family)